MAEPAPKIFVSWSGDHAETVAGLVHEWLNKAYQRIDVFFSPDSIDKGDRSLSKIEAELDGCIAAIVVVTAESMKSAWVNFEAGALSALRLPDGRPRLVIPLLVGVGRVTDVTGPLTQFQAVLLNLTDFKRMITSLNRVLSIGDADWTERIVSTTKREIEAILNSGTIPVDEKAPERSDREILEEILINVRAARTAAYPSTEFIAVFKDDESRVRNEIDAKVDGMIDPWDYTVDRDFDGNYVLYLEDSVPEGVQKRISESLPGIEVTQSRR